MNISIFPGSSKMNRPETNNPALEEDTDSVSPAASWGEKEEARQIALLEAVVRLDHIHHVIDEITAPKEGDDDSTLVKGQILPFNLESELRFSYLDYAMTVICGRALDPGKAAGTLRRISRRVSMEPCGLIGCLEYERRCPTLTLRQLQKQALTAALAILRLDQAARNARISALLLKMLTSANAARYGFPLFAYGAELSEYRHRLR
ncbi:hypothetical protein M1B34_06790 [Pseudomonas sp. MAFF 302030]|uniref:Uncharacterized protein n=1 Tax=Pseudomonas morbosilactucae TaxID=2938197 RepID=A0A9X2C4X6_9PSED|nr:hypothetical protein [Pseudomonas morbosilactucae]MCK9797451.1 hypothetical protein [Pseudomonas morbosilactucae]